MIPITEGRIGRILVNNPVLSKIVSLLARLDKKGGGDNVMSVYDRHYIHRMVKNAGKLSSLALTS